MPRALKLMAEYSAFPLWDISGDGPYAWQYMVDEVPVSAELRASLIAWHDVLEDQDPFSDDWDADLTWHERIDEGRLLAARLRHELGPDYEITYFHEDDRGLEDTK